MKIALVSSFVPFIGGGFRNLVDWLATELEDRGHQVEKIYLPFDESPDLLFGQLSSYRGIDLSERADLAITFRPPAHFIHHPRKVVWFLHHFRQYYDLWESTLNPMEKTEVDLSRRSHLHRLDRVALSAATKVFTNSAVVSERLRTFNGIQAEVLYPPVSRPDQFRCLDWSSEIVMISRIEEHKRQHLLIEALARTRYTISLKFIGATVNQDYLSRLRRRIRTLGLGGRVSLENRWSTEREKNASLSRALCNVYFPVDEDSYGFSTIEAALSSKPTLTTTDSGGVLEFVTDGESGIVCPPSPFAIAEQLDNLFRNRDLAKAMGLRARLRVDDLGITWDSVIDRLLS